MFVVGIVLINVPFYQNVFKGLSMKSKASEVDKLLAKGFSNIFNLSDPTLYLDKEGNITDTKIMSEIDYNRLNEKLKSLADSMFLRIGLRSVVGYDTFLDSAIRDLLTELNKSSDTVQLILQHLIFVLSSTLAMTRETKSTTEKAVLKISFIQVIGTINLVQTALCFIHQIKTDESKDEI